MTKNPNSTSVAGLLLDMDGTIVNSEPYWIASEREVVQAHGRVWSERDGKQLVGKAIVRASQIMIDQTGMEATAEEVSAQIIATMQSHYRQNGVPWIDGVVPVLKEFANAQIPVCIVSSSPNCLVSTVAENAPAGCISATVAGDEVDNPKPSPDPYLRAAEKLGVDIRKCLVVEDSNSGLQAGIASGTAVVAVQGVAPVEDYPTVYHLHSLAELTVGKAVELVERTQ